VQESSANMLNKLRQTSAATLKPKNTYNGIVK